MHRAARPTGFEHLRCSDYHCGQWHDTRQLCRRRIAASYRVQRAQTRGNSNQTSRLTATNPARHADHGTHAEAATQKLLHADTNPISRRSETALYRFELTTQDQPGLLANVGWALAACHVSLRGAKISTFGERAEDFFYISDKTGDPLEEQQCKELGDLIQKVLAPR